MSVTFDVVINPVILFAALLGGVLVGFVIGRGKLAKNKFRIQQLESEILSCHQETLEAQRAYVMLQSNLKDQSIPVIPMKINGSKENTKEKATN
jgi:RNase P/RNase MRP subunit POP5